MEVESISDILSGKEPPAAPVTDVKETPAAPSAASVEAPKDEPKAEVKETPVEAKSDEAKARDEKGRFQKAEKVEPMVPLAALLAERAKRQSPEPAKPKTSFLDNEEQAFTERAQEHMAPIKEALFEMSVEFAKSRYDDFDEVAGVFSQAAQNDERLWAQMREAKNPAMYIYNVGQQFKELAPFKGDVIRYKDHAVSETKAELAKAQERIKALEAENETVRKSKEALESLPRSLNASPGGTPKSGEVEDAEDIKTIVRFGNKRT